MPANRLFPDQRLVRINIQVPESHHTELKELAGYEGKSVAALVRELIAGFLNDTAEVHASGLGGANNDTGQVEGNEKRRRASNGNEAARETA